MLIGAGAGFAVGLAANLVGAAVDRHPLDAEELGHRVEQHNSRLNARMEGPSLPELHLAPRAGPDGGGLLLFGRL